MINVDDKFVTLREVVSKKVLSVRDSVYAVFLLTIIVKKMQYESRGGGHFNINPDTVLVMKEENEEVKVKLLGEDKPHQECSGKPDFDTKELNQCFRAPETFLGRFSPASDVFSLGMLLAFMIQGCYPFPFNETTEAGKIREIIRNTKSPILDGIPPGLDCIIRKALSKTTFERYKETGELGLALMDYLGMEKNKNFCCFSDDNKKRINEAKQTETENKYMLETNCSPQEPQLSVDLSVRTGDGFKAVAGMEDIKKILRRDFVEIISHRELAKKFGIMPSNMLFYGAPGTGKTYISQKLAEECGLACCYVRPSDLGSVWLHGSQGLIKELFAKAEDKAKQNERGCILLIDEFDALCGAREAKGNEFQADEVAEWLTQLNDCVEKNVFVIGTTNCLERIDKAVIRHGRIDQVVYVSLPDFECRKQLFEIELNKRPHDEGIDVDELARITEGFTSSDISYMVKETARNAFEKSIRNETEIVVNISEEMIRKVVKETRPSVTQDEIRKYEKMRDDYERRNKKERPRIGFLA